MQIRNVCTPGKMRSQIMNFVRVRRKDLTSFKQVQIRFHYNLSHSHVLGNFIQIKHGMKLALSKLNCFQKYLTFDVNWLPWKMILKCLQFYLWNLSSFWRFKVYISLLKPKYIHYTLPGVLALNLSLGLLNSAPYIL